MAPAATRPFPSSVPAFAEIGAQSNYSLLDGASHPHEMVKAAKQLGLAGIGICDTNSLAGIVRAHLAAKQIGMPLAIGARLLLEDGSRYLAWATDRAGYGRLCRMLSLGRLAAPKGGCALSRSLLLEHTTAGGLLLAALPPDDPTFPTTEFVERLVEDVSAHSHLPLPLHLAVCNRYAGGAQRRIHALLKAAAKTGAQPFATNLARYHAGERRQLADTLTAIRLGVTVDQLGFAAEPNSEGRLKSPDEMAELFAAWPELLRPSLEILEACQGFSLDCLQHEYPEELLEAGKSAQETLETRVAAACPAIWPNGVPTRMAQRLQHELSLIAQLNYAPYFLTVDEIVRFARSRGILCQGRGSAANSVVCYVLGITSVDPEKHDLLFERFVSTARAEPPDIDVDFEHERREEVIQHVYERYGRHRAAIVGTVIRFRTRSAIREIGKVLGLSEDATARIAKVASGPGAPEEFAAAAKEAGYDPDDHRLRLSLDLADQIQDFPRHLATHVGGFVITRGPLIELAVVGNAAMEDRTVLEWDKDDIAALGLMKVDLLALGMLSCIHRAFDLLRAHRGIALTLTQVPRDNAPTYQMLRRTDSVGVFQVESRAQMNMLPRLRPEKFYDLVVQVAIIRPGPIQGQMVHPYLRRRWGLEKVEYPSPAPGHGDRDELKSVLHRTLGVPLFQEQAMRLAMVAAGFSADEAEKLRKAMGTYRAIDGVASWRARLVTGMVRRGYAEELAHQVFDQIEGFGSYGFPESHAASFAYLAYVSAWIKCHHPAVFTCALLNSQPMGFYAPAQLVRDAKAHGVEVRPIDVSASNWDCTLEPAPHSAEGLAIRLGLRLVGHLNMKDAQAIIAARSSGNGAPFTSVSDLARRAGVGRATVEALAAADALTGLGADRVKGSWEAAALPKSGKELPLFAFAEDQPPLFNEPEPSLPAPKLGAKVVGDYLATGLSLAAHPLELIRPQLSDLGYADTAALHRARDGARIRLPGLVLMRQRPSTAKGIVFLTLEDEHGTANIVVFPDIVSRDRAAVINGQLLVVEGTVERETRYAEVPVTHLIAKRVIDQSRLLAALPDTDPGTEVRPIPLQKARHFH